MNIKSTFQNRRAGFVPLASCLDNIRWILLISLHGYWGSFLQGQEAILTLNHRDVLPGANFSLFVEAQLNKPIRGFQFGVEYPQYAIRLLRFSFDGTAVGRKPLEVFNP